MKILLNWVFIFLGLIKIIYADDNFNSKLNSSNIIYLKVKGNNNYQKLINSKYIPDKVYQNGVQINYIGYLFIGNNKYNNITLIWKDKFNTTEFLFDSLTGIIEIDLSNFDTSEVTSMYGMFSYCNNLQYINFANINTSSVSNMNQMFAGCNSLLSLDLSNFDTSKVKEMSFMFYGCRLLPSIDLSNFRTPNLRKMNSIFSGCYSLKSIDLTSFDTTKVYTLELAFYECLKLTSINLKNFDVENVNSFSQMFSYCVSLISLDLSNFITYSAERMDEMFLECSSLVSLNIQNFDTFYVESLDFMFYKCSSLTSIDISFFSIYKAEMNYFFSDCNSLTTIKMPEEIITPNSIIYMFNGCSSLISLDLINFDFGYCKDMQNLFSGCLSLKSIEISDFNSFSPEIMDYMFYDCTSLERIDLSEIDTEDLKSIIYLFYDCTSLIELNLANFDTHLVTNMKYTFANCIKLTSINLESFDTSLTADMQSMFYGCISLLSLNLSNFDTSNVNNMKSMFFGCVELTSLDLSNFNFESIYTMSSMFLGCSNLAFINLYNYNDSTTINKKKIFSGTADNLIIVINDKSITEGLVPELSSLNCIINNSSINIEEKNKRIIFDTRKCIEDCQFNSIYKYEYENYCYKECPYGSYSLSSNEFICKQKEKECQDQYPFLNLKDNSCLENCYSEDFFNQKCSLKNNISKGIEILISNIRNEIKDGSLEHLLIKDNKEIKDLIRKDNNIVYQITTSYNQNNNDYQNITTIKLGEFENELKEKYNILKSDSLIIFKIEKYLDKALIPLIEYEIFHPETKEKIELNIYEGTFIDIYIPVSIKENELYKYNLNCSYYNDICNLNNITDKYDKTLYDRKNEFINNNWSLCPVNCKYIDYDIKTKKSICKCKIQGDIISFDKIYEEEKKRTIINVKRKTNLNIMKCYKNLFTKEGLLKNIGSYIFLIIIFLYIILSIAFYYKGYDFLCHQIDILLNKKTIGKLKDKYNKNNLQIEEKLKQDFSSEILTSTKSPKNKKDKNIINKSKSEIDSNIDFNKELSEMKKGENDKKAENIDYMGFTESEINNIPYEKALDSDKRTFFQYYISLLKINHIIIFTFNKSKDYNSFFVKLSLLLFSIALMFVINTLFFNDYTLHKVYEDKGTFNFIYILPKIIYSIIICSIINFFLKFLFLSQKNILELKYEENKYNLKAKAILTIKRLIIKYITFYAITFLLLLLFWYYLSSFCLIYKNTQIYLIKTILLSYAISIICQFIFYLIPCIIRYISLRNPGKCFYDISQIIQSF